MAKQYVMFKDGAGTYGPSSETPKYWLNFLKHVGQSPGHSDANAQAYPQMMQDKGPYISWSAKIKRELAPYNLRYDVWGKQAWWGMGEHILYYDNEEDVKRFIHDFS